MAKTVFYSFHYTRDVHRVQLVRNVNALEGQPLLNAQEWEQVKGRGDGAIENWIDDKMKYKRAVVVLVGQETADRPWVRYEISKAWRDCKPLLGVRIHGLSAMGKIDRAGSDPFKAAGITDTVPIFDPTRLDGYGRIDSQLTYNTLRSNLQAWSERGLSRRS
ncbi:TIR domain-containing protein [Rhodococcoides kyotonense]|uniref:MTH538 TIR-like domain n=1 Tax=Rhodococcoides kyotonense TaxID=398843 RepID=A0A239N585_9NOCA|nr:TIR domain-containing protein [Rhodococcus kyotonensis]SNT50187.1 MTH538 TIR-like domain [Rhodococcus kyotonensis]